MATITAAAAAAAAAGHHTKATHRGQKRVPESHKPTGGSIFELHAVGDDRNVGQEDAWRLRGKREEDFSNRGEGATHAR